METQEMLNLKVYLQRLRKSHYQQVNKKEKILLSVVDFIILFIKEMPKIVNISKNCNLAKHYK